MRIFIIILSFFFLYIHNAHGQTDKLQKMVDSSKDSIGGLAVLYGGDQMAVSTNNGDQGKLFIISLRDCVQIRRFVMDSPLSSVIADPTDAGAVWSGQGSFLKKWNTTDGKELYSNDIMQSFPIKGIKASSSGNYVAVWSNGGAALLRLNKDNVTVMWKEGFNFAISDMVIDERSKNAYIGSSDGTFVKKTFNGMTANSFSTGSPILSLAVDPLRDTVFIATQKGLVRYEDGKSLFVRISLLPTSDVAISADANTLYTVGSGSYSLFSYPKMQLVHTHNIKGGKLYVLPNGSSITYDNNELSFYDNKVQKSAGKAYFVNDSVGFVSSDMNYYGNDNFKSAVSNGLVRDVPPFLISNRQPDQQAACAPFKEMITSVYMPQTKNVPAPATPTVNTPAVKPQAQVSKPSGSAAVNTPAKPSVPSLQPVQSGNTSQAVAQPKTPSVKSPVVNPAAPSLPVVPVVASPIIAPGADIPTWVIKPDNLPRYSAVRSGKDAASGLREAKIKIRDEIARNIMKNMLDVEIVKQLDTDDLKKRFLWMVGGRTAQLGESYVVQTDLWVSKDGIFYVLGQVDSKTVDQLYAPIFQEELSLLQTYGVDNYMQRPPVKWN